jgi:hypothetical protein
MSIALSHFREQAAWALAPFFLEGTQGDEEKAQEAAGTMLDDYKPATPKELQLSAQIVAYGFASLACLRSVMAAKNLPIKDVLDLQDAALALDRFAQKSTKDLLARQRERVKAPHMLTPEKTRWDEAGFADAMSKAMAKMRLADSKIPELVTTVRKPRKPKLRIVSSAPMTSAVLRHLAKTQTDEAVPPAGPRRH